MLDETGAVIGTVMIAESKFRDMLCKDIAAGYEFAKLEKQPGLVPLLDIAMELYAAGDLEGATKQLRETKALLASESRGLQ
jgi:hypothetical protein